jgi:hypothetical protein
MTSHLSLWAPNLWIPGETGQKSHHNPYAPAAQTSREFKPSKYAFETTHQRSYPSPSTWKPSATASPPAGGSYAQAASSSPRRSAGDFKPAQRNKDEVPGRLWRTTYQDSYGAPAAQSLLGGMARRSVRKVKQPSD